VTILGPPDTLYEGGFFNAVLKFPKDYPQSPPECKFTSEMWHPNGTWLVCCAMRSMLLPNGCGVVIDRTSSDRHFDMDAMHMQCFLTGKCVFLFFILLDTTQ
jgi:hypothetical protein